MSAGRARNQARARARQARPKPWGELPAGTGAESGFLLLDKDPAVTSHDVVGAVRRLAATRQVGHAGTLDPMATGLLVIAIGRATKLIQYLAGAPKTYTATICFGVGSSTDDADGELFLAPPAEFSAAELVAAMAEFLGDIWQVPAAVSAIKIAGKRAHDLVRDGNEVQLEPRQIHISQFAPTSQLQPGTLLVGDSETEVQLVDVIVSCSSGTYVRALARDLGEKLGTKAHLRALRRTEIGPWQVAQASSVSDLKAAVAAGAELPVHTLASVCRAIFPAVSVTAAEAQQLRRGLFIPMRSPQQLGYRGEQGENWPAVAVDSAEIPISLVSPRRGELKPDLQLVIPAAQPQSH
ncbi:MAG: tRNA pseudouridine(55) synthase TruB [Trueperella sp.]|nr:tRNA pseudouridine(55) synthase TruB [Trueperella sp.]